MPFQTQTDHGRMASVKAHFPEVTMSAPSPSPTPLQIGLVLFPRVTQLDFTGPGVTAMTLISGPLPE